MSRLEIDLDQLKRRDSTAKVFFTFDQIKNLPEWPSSPLLEIIEGELFMPPSPSIYHHDISARIVSYFRKILEEHRIFNAPVDVVLSEENVVIPDIFVVDVRNIEIVKDKNIEGVPDLIVEILSQNREKDIILKKQLYEKYGVREYWIVDPDEKTIRRLNLKMLQGTPKYIETASFALQDAITSEVYSEIEIPLEDIF